MGIRREGSASAPLIRLRCLIGEEETRVGHGVTRPEPLSRYIAVRPRRDKGDARPDLRDGDARGWAAGRGRGGGEWLLRRQLCRKENPGPERGRTRLRSRSEWGSGRGADRAPPGSPEAQARAGTPSAAGSRRRARPCARPRHRPRSPAAPLPAAPAPRPPPRAGSSVAFSHGLCGFRCQDPGASRPSPPRSRRRREPGRASSPQRALSSGEPPPRLSGEPGGSRKEGSSGAADSAPSTPPADLPTLL